MVRTQGKETTVVFSCVGYRRKEMKLKLGQSVGVQVELQEENNQLEEVFVVPGNITSPMSAGCNALIRQGATPATSVEDITEVILPQAPKP